MHGFQTLCAIVAHTGEDGSDGIDAGASSDRFEQCIHGGFVLVDGGTVLYAADPVSAFSLYAQVEAAGSDIDVAGKDSLAVFCLKNSTGAGFVETVGESAAVAWREMLGDDGAWGVGGKLVEDFANGFGTAGGSADGDQAVCSAKAGCDGRSLRRTRGRSCRRAACKWTNSRAGSAFHFVDDFPGEFVETGGQIEFRFSDKVDGSERKCLQCDFGAALGERTYHDDRHGPEPHQVPEERPSIHPRHLDVQSEHVGVGHLDQLTSFKRVRSFSDYLDIRIAFQDIGQQAAYQGGIVDDGDADFRHYMDPSESWHKTGQGSDADKAGVQVVDHTARGFAPKATGSDAESSGEEELFNELGIFVADPGGETADACSAENLYFEAVAAASCFQNFADQVFHGTSSEAVCIAGVIAGVGSGPGQQEMIHAAHQ